jgi:FkbM family methyltransferase
MNLKQVIKAGVDALAAVFDKRITNIHAPAKPFRQGVNFLKELIDAPAVIIDIGVADGTPDLTSSFPYRDYKYLLIEANPKFSNYLDESQKKYPDQVLVEKVFCGEREMTIPFFLNKTGHTASRYYTVGQNGQIEVPVVPLDTLIDKYKLSGPFLLKVDVEGAELDVLKGAEQTLKKCDIVILETWVNVPGSAGAPDFADLVSFMKIQGFVVFDFFAGHTHQNGVLAHIDTVFVKEESRYRHNA